MASIAIAGTFNSRSVGWSATPSLIRAANLDAITDVGVAALTELGVALVVDLRDDQERGSIRHTIPVRHVPIYRSPDGPPLTGTLESVYESMVYTRGRELTTAVAAIADSSGPVLVHCASGKDRTGLVIALALLAAGISDDEVIADYTLSAAIVRPNRRESVEVALRALRLTNEVHAAALRLHLDSPAVALRQTLDDLEEFGGVTPYLRGHGLTVDQFETLRERIGGAIHEC